MCFETTTSKFSYPTSHSDFDSPAVFNDAMMQYFNADEAGKLRFFDGMTRDVFDMFSMGMATYIMLYSYAPELVTKQFDFTVAQSKEFAARMLIKYDKDFA